MIILRVLLMTTLLNAGTFAGEYWPTQGWRHGAPEDQQLNGEPFARLGEAVRKGTHGHVDRMLVIRNGIKVVDEGFPQDYKTLFKDADPASHQYNYHHPDWHPFYKRTDLHTLQSVTKSVTTTLVGIALQRGEIKDLQQPVLSFFKDFDLSKLDPRLHKADLVDLLTMRSGIKWHETDRPIGPTNSAVQLESQQDWLRFVLAQPMDAEPGEKWVYSSGNSQLVSHIIKQATGKHVHDYAREHLFKPLGIDNFHWKTTPKGYADTEGGLYLEAEQLAKIGYLYLRDGQWDGKQILPKGWAREATRRVVSPVSYGFGYGYQWWRADKDGVEIWAGMGYGGQLLLIFPEQDLIAVANCWDIADKGHQPFYTGLVGAILAALE